ncbi:hypothetical protein HYPSUDRAFT_59626 [Hypholoma sublateritium FD-334 SS-4]|uniref:Uncharacterized protein n=1 Tax=Hypholoma sublateritium (strain FD-334 SS-4) TaxID=945553 RepID=A0A0D2NBL9_HYPSF|nr:hypothetical protein HYPSUDRAFT_59626 [Hypholoma sublateritium FD-334 SS-4]
MPALQVVDGTRDATASQRAVNFFSTHGSTIAILSKNEDEYVTLPTLAEVHLIIPLYTSILPLVLKTEMLSPNSSFGVIHAAILRLATRCLGHGRMFAYVVPQSDTDVKLGRTVAFGHGGKMKFDVKVQREEPLLRKSVCVHIGAPGNFTAEITLVLSPVTITPRSNEQTTHFSAAIPTVGDALGALDDMCTDFATTLKQISDIGAELAHQGQTGAASANESLHDVDPALLRDLGALRTFGVASARALLGNRMMMDMYRKGRRDGVHIQIKRDAGRRMS